MRPDLPPDLRAALAAEPDGDDLAAVWDALGDGPPAADTAAAWANLRPRLDRPAPPHTREGGVVGERAAPDRPAARPARRARWAAGVLAGVALAAVVWLAVPATYEAAPGETATVALPDGSEAVLNSGTALEWSRWPVGARRVALAGEAFFEVVPGEAPFVVQTADANVTVLGTAFNVRAWPAEGETAVAVAEGRVRVAPAGAEAVVLGAGEGASAGAGGAVPAAVDAERAAGWRTGALTFEDRPLADVLAEVARRYDTAIAPGPGAPLGVRVSAHYGQRPALEALLGDLGAAAGVRFEAHGAGYQALPARGARPAPPAPTARP